MDQVGVNAKLWREGRHVDVYANRSLSPAEVLILVRYREQLGKRVLEAGCGAGRVLGYLLQLGGEVHGIDVAPAMVEYCRRAYPAADVRVGDVSALSELVSGKFDVIFAANNLIDVFDDTRRRAALAEFARCLAPGGLLIFSSHNLAERHRSIAPERASAGRRVRRVAGAVLRKSPVELWSAARRAPALVRNRRRLAPLERTTPEYAIVNEKTFDYGLVHYYVQRDAQQRQLREAGLELIECLDPDGDPVKPGEDGRGPWLHYIARAGVS